MVNITVLFHFQRIYTGPVTRGTRIETQGDKLNQLKLLRGKHSRSATTGALG